MSYLESLSKGDPDDIIKEINKEKTKILDLTEKVKHLNDDHPVDPVFVMENKNTIPNLNMNVTLENKIEFPQNTVGYKYSAPSLRLFFGYTNGIFVVKLPLVFQPQIIEYQDTESKLIDFVILEATQFLICQFEGGQIVPYMLKENRWGKLILSTKNEIQIRSSKSFLMIIEKPSSVYISDASFNQFFNNKLGFEMIKFGELVETKHLAIFAIIGNDILIFSIDTKTVLNRIQLACNQISYSLFDHLFIYADDNNVALFSSEAKSILYKIPVLCTRIFLTRKYYLILGKKNETSPNCLYFIDLVTGKTISVFRLQNEDIVDFTAQLDEVLSICIKTASNSFYLFKVRSS